MKSWSLILTFFSIFLSPLAYSQAIEANILDSNGQKVVVFLSPEIKYLRNSSYFAIKIDSFSDPALSQQIWNVKILLHIKTNVNEFYVRKKLLYPINNQWDTTFSKKLIGYEIQYVQLQRSKQLSELIEQLKFIDSLMGVFPDCYNQQALSQLHTMFTRIISSSIGCKGSNQVYMWLSDQLAALGVEFINKDCPNAGLELLYNSLMFNSSNTYANYELAKLYFSGKDFFKSYEHLKLASQKICAKYYDSVIDLSRLLSKKFIDLGEKTQVLEQSYRYFCMADTLRSLYTLDLQGFDEKFKQLIKHYFDFRTTKLLQLSQFLDLDSLFSQFVDLTYFFKNYEQYLDNEDIKRLNELFNLVLNRINSSIEQGNYASGLKYLRFMSKIDKLLTKNSHLDKLKHSQYHGHILYANYLLQNDSLTRAKQQLKLAENLFMDDNFSTDSVVAGLALKQSNDLTRLELTIINHYAEKKQYDSALCVLNSLQTAEFNILDDKKLDSLKRQILFEWADFMLDTLQHKTGLNKIEKFILRYHLTNNQRIWNKYQYKLKILFASNCQRQHLKFFKTFEKIDSLLQKRQFLAAKDTMELYLANAHQCLINTDTIQKFIRYYRYPIIYQNLIDAYDDYLKNHDYELAYSTLKGIEQYFYQNRLDKYGFSRPDLYKMINKHDTAFLRFAIHSLILDDSLTLSLKLLEIFHTKHIASSLVKNLQAELGYKLALYDFLLSPHQKPWHSLKTHLPKPDFWYLPLIRAYFKQRKKMRSFKF